MRTFIRFIALLLVFAALAVALTPTLAADPPKITVTPAWRPATQLTSDYVTEGKYRYVDVEILVTASVNYWAAQFNCKVNPAVLEGYTPYLDPYDPGDDVPMVRWNLDWGNMSGDYTAVNEAFKSDGSMTFTAAKYGFSSPMGGSGVNTTQLVATLHYRVKNVAGTSTFTCTTAFLNRDGKPVLAATYVAPAPLKISTGYTISGKVTYQAAPASPTSISVECWHEYGFGYYQPVVNTSGIFTASNVRHLGPYSCWFYGNVLSPGSGADLHLRARTWFELTGDSITLLPVVLKSGNVDPYSSPMDIDIYDIWAVTYNWNATGLPPFSYGEANGDGKIDRADLAIVAGNYYWHEEVNAQHLLYSLPRSTESYVDSRIWRGQFYEADLVQQIPGTNKDYWPALSPNGAWIAFTRNVSGKYALYIQKSDGTGTATRLTPANVAYDAFAPAWSPDGTRLAFICSSNSQWHYADQGGDMCMVDLNGANLRTITSQARVYPPAWVNNNAILFGGNPGNWHCPATICLLDLPTGAVWEFDRYNIPVGSDMPAVTWGGGAFLYRYSDGLGNRILRFAELIGTFGVAPWQDVSQSPSPPFHVDVTWDNGGGTFTPVATDVDYYVISPISADILYYGTGGCFFRLSTFNGIYPAPRWQPEWWYWLRDQGCNVYWDGSPMSYTDLFGLRNTVDWAP